jgi:hypothetical protein
MECEQIKTKLRQDAVSLISCCWRGIDWENVGARRRMKIYEEFAAKIKSATATGTLSHFLEKLCQKMDANISGADAPTVLKIIRDVETDDLDLEILDILRSDTEYIVLLMREANNELKENSKQLKLGELA